MTAENVTSVGEVVALTDEPKIAKLQKVDEMLVYKSIGRLLARLVVDLHIADGLSTGNIKNIAKRLTTDSELRWWLTLADVDLLCRRIVAGDFGKFYGHFGEGEFNECLVKYCNERTETHRINATNNVVKPDVSVLSEVGYKMGKDGRLEVPEEKQGIANAKPPRYLYNDKGQIIGENPKYWAKYHKEQEKTTEEMQRINESNKQAERIMQIMDEWQVSYAEAVMLYHKEVKDVESEKEETTQNETS